MPPFLKCSLVWLRVIEAQLAFQTKSFIIFWVADSTSFCIP